VAWEVRLEEAMTWHVRAALGRALWRSEAQIPLVTAARRRVMGSNSPPLDALQPTSLPCTAPHAGGPTRHTPIRVVRRVPRPARKPTIREAMSGRLRQLELSRNHARRRPSQEVTAADSKLDGCGHEASHSRYRCRHFAGDLAYRVRIAARPGRPLGPAYGARQRCYQCEAMPCRRCLARARRLCLPDDR